MKDEATIYFLDHMTNQAKYRRAHGGRAEANEAMRLENYLANRKKEILAAPDYEDQAETGKVGS